MTQANLLIHDGVVRQHLAAKNLAVGLSDREETTSNRVTSKWEACWKRRNEKRTSTAVPAVTVGDIWLNTRTSEGWNEVL